jgi:hypothetical protein
MSMAFALAAPLIIHVVWHGKWDMSIAATQILAACVPAWLVIHSVRALLEARGLWRLRFLLLAGNGIGGIAAAALGTWLGSVATIALSVSLFYVFFSLTLLVLLRGLGLRLDEIASITIKPVVLNCIALAIALAAALHTVVVQIAIFLAIAGLANAWLCREDWSTLLHGLTARLRSH